MKESPPSVTVRIAKSDDETLKALAEETATTMLALMHEALESYRRSRLFDRADQVYATLLNDAGAWAAERNERDAWADTLMDGLESGEE